MPMKTSIDLSEESEIYFIENEVVNLMPGESMVWELSGPAGTKYESKLEFQGGGGHSHGIGSTSSRAVGKISPKSGTIKNTRKIEQTFKAGKVCGIVKDTTVMGNTVIVKTYHVAIPGLVPFKKVKGVILVGETDKHPSNHWGTPASIEAIKSIGEAYHKKFKKHIYINDMSLPTGGVFDIKGNFTHPHKTHKEGRHVDINWSSMTEEEAVWFEKKSTEIGFKVDLHGQPKHWHLRFG